MTTKVSRSINLVLLLFVFISSTLFAQNNHISSSTTTLNPSSIQPSSGAADRSNLSPSSHTTSTSPVNGSLQTGTYTTTGGGRNCGTMDLLDKQIQADPDVSKQMDQLNTWVADYIQNHPPNSQAKGGPALYTIPVVFHVVYRTAQENISDAQILSQLDVLNEDFRKLNADTVNIPGIFQGIAADTKIEFCLAVRDPSGNPTTGITRTSTSVNSFSTNDNIKFNSSGGRDAWPRDDYMNFWSGNLSGGLLGYAQFPGGTANTDGVVCLYTSIGRPPDNPFGGSFNQGRTATHEVGHWLGLYHIWGDDGGGCGGSDQVADTPNSGNSYGGCPSHPQTSCSSQDNFNNYMDYVDDLCMNMFTSGQKDRMDAVMNGSRVSLQSSLGCVPLGPPTCAFSGTPLSILENETVTFTDASAGATSWSWEFESGTPTTSTAENPTITYTTAGVYDVTLTATNASGSCTLTEPNYVTVTVPPAPICDFSASPTSVGEGGTVNFTDLSQNSPTSWTWTFESGTPSTSTAQNPSVTYAATGVYSVTLSASNGTGSCQTVQTAYITVTPSAHCDTLNNPISGTLSYGSTTTCGILGGWSGYVAGYNCYDDQAKAEKILATNYGSNTHVTGLAIGFRSAYDDGNGSTISVTIWDDDGAGGTPNTILASQTYLLSDIDAVVNPYGVLDFFFINPVAVSGDFYIGYSMNLSVGDSLGTFTNADNGTSMTAWEQWDDNSWNDFGSWGYSNFSQYIQAYMTDLPVDANPTVNQLFVCEGGTLDYDASSSVDAVMGYQWQFNGGTPTSSTSTTPSPTYNTAGIYTTYLTASGYCGGISIDSIANISVTASPSLSTSVTDESCGMGNGTATVIATGGTPGYTYDWSSGGNSQTESGLSAGSASVTVTDNNSCSSTTSATVSNVSGPTASVTSTDESCGNTNGTATAIPSGGTGPYTYNWSTGGTSQTENNLSAGSYDVTVTDFTGCTVTGSISISNISGPTASTTVSAATCGASNGSATAIPIGGTSPYTYTWSSGGSAQTESSLGAGSYSVTVTDGGGCTVTTNANISSSGGPTGTTTVTNATCGLNNGQSGISVTGGSTPYTYNWSSGGSSAVENNLSGGSYNVTVTDAASCAIVEAVSVNDLGTPSASITVTDETCNMSNGTATAIPSGGAGGYTYSWSSGGSGITETNLGNGGISVTVTDANSCTVTASESINNVSGPTASMTTTDATCASNNGTATAIPVGGVGPYTYNWSTGGSTQTISSLAATGYDVTITDNNSCTVTASGTVASSTGPSVTVSSTDANCGMYDGVATASVSGGTSPLTYIWDDGLSQASSSATGLSSGNYSVTVSDNNGCSSIQSVSVGLSGGSPKYTVSMTTPVCNGPDLSWSITDQFGVTVSSGTIGHGITQTWEVCQCGETFILNAPAGTTGPGPQRCTTDISPGMANVYDESMTLIGSVTTDGSTIDLSGYSNCSLPCPTVSTTTTNASCGSADGTATAIVTGGNSPFSYNWSSGGSAITENGLNIGNYFVTVTDAAACNVTASANIINSLPIVSVTSTDATCGNSNGSATATGGAGATPYTYNWSSGGSSNSESTLPSGTYTVTVTDASSCVATTTVSVNNIAGPTASISSTNSTCGNANGSATAIPAGGTAPFNYNWSSGGTSQTENNLTVGNYSVTIADGNSCTVTQNVSISNTSGPSSSVATSNASCGGSNGTATAITSGGTTPFSYNWSNGGSSATIVSLPAATYTVTITDGNSCESVSSGNVSNIGGPTASITTTDETCENGNGSATALVSGGSTPYTFNWSSGGTTSTENNLSAGSYTVTVSDAASCNTVVSESLVNQASPTITTSVTDASCGSSNGTATAIVTGGTSPITYSWSSGGSSATEINLGPGGYNVTVSDANTCTVTASVVINNDTPGLSTSVTNASCGNNNGTATVVTSGGTTPFNYVWSSGGSLATETGLSAGNYFVTVTDAASCISTEAITIVDAGGLTTLNITTSNSTCGNSNGEATAIASGGTMPYSYNWSNGESTMTISGIVANTYFVTVSDLNSCTLTTSGTVNNTSGPNLSILPTNANCGQANGSATAFAGGGTTPFVYNWSNGGSTSTQSNLTPGNYSLTLTDGNSCVVIESTVVGNNSGPSISTSTTSSTCGNANGAAVATASGGSAPYNYLWSTGATSNSISNVVSGNYSVTATDVSGCYVTTTVPISNMSGPSIAVSPTDATCGSSNGSATSLVTGGSSPFNYAWSSGGSSSTENGLVAGNYFLTVNDNNGCVAITSFNINSSGISVTSSFVNETCSNSNGSASVTVSGGTSPYSYLWSNGGTSSNESNLSAGSYGVTISDQNGCNAFESFNLNNSPAPVATVSTTAAACGSSNATATASVASGTAPYTYAWSSGGNSATESGLSSGGYSLTVSDVNSCLTTVAFNVNNTAPVITASASNASCGNSNGSALVSASGGTIPYTYQWSSGGTSNVESNLPSGVYDVTVMDASSCMAFASVTVGDTPPPTLTTSTTDATCGGNNGTATVMASSGTSPYNYMWSSGANTSTALNLSAGTYSVIVTDNLGCSSIANVTVNNPGNIAATSTVIDESCGQSNGEASLSITGGTSPYSVSWSGGAGNNTTATGLSAGSYSATIFDVNSCVTVHNVSIANTAGPSISLSSSNESCGNDNGSATAIASGGSLPYTLIWSNGGMNSTETGLSSGQYFVTVTDFAGCEASGNVSISNIAGPTASVNTSDEICGQQNGSANVTLAGGTAPISYLWSNGGNTNLITGLSSGTYTVTVTDGNGCDAVVSGLVNSQSGPVIAASGTNETCTSANGTGTVVVNGGTAPYVYAWSAGSNTDSQSGISAGTYSVTVIDNNGCTAVSSISITNNTHTLSVTSNNANCGDDNGTAQAIVSGGMLPYNYFWSNGTGSVNVQNLAPGSYTVTVTDGNWCVLTDVVTIGTTPIPVVTVSTTDATCDIANGSASVSVTGGESPYTFAWSGTSGNTATQDSLAGDTYSVFVTDNDGCMKSTLVIIGNYSSPTVTVTETAATCESDNGSAVADAEGGTGLLIYEWSNGEITETTTGLTDDIYYVSVTDANNCLVVDTAEITRIDGICLEVPSGFSPNGDGVNDVWNIYGTEFYTDIKVEVYNRWGSILFSSEGYTEPWTGLNQNGKEVPAAVYYYIVTLGEETRTGTVTIKR